MKKGTLLIAGLLLAAAVVSCGETPATEPQSTEKVDGPSSETESESVSETEAETEPATEEPDYRSWVVYTVYPEPDIPEDLDLSGKTFLLSVADRVESSFLPESLIGEIVNDAVYNRNLQTEEHFGIKFDAQIAYGNDANLTMIATAGLSEFDMVFGLGETLTGLTALGYARDFTDIPYVDLSDEFWYPGLLDCFACFDRLFLMPSDMSQDVLAEATVTFFNKRLLAEYDLESPYQMVYDNTWTLDNFLTMARKVSKDLNGDGMMGEDDQYGIGLHDGRILGTFMHLMLGCDVRLSSKDEDGAVLLDPDGEKIQRIIDKTAEVLKDRSISFDNDGWSRANLPKDFYYTPFFDNGQILFQLDPLSVFPLGRREMEDDFGIAPIPKYDSSQETYQHRPSVLTCLFCVPSTAPDLEKTGAVFSYMSWLSTQTVLPAFYEVTLNQKRTRDEDSAAMLDLVRRSFYYEFV
ncbi:MAG: hypothetical protein II719_05335, partial [Clostridia bacterium]|nr:hypothetical protein [Clostridia bacterium]